MLASLLVGAQPHEPPEHAQRWYVRGPGEPSAHQVNVTISQGASCDVHEPCGSAVSGYACAPLTVVGPASRRGTHVNALELSIVPSTIDRSGLASVAGPASTSDCEEMPPHPMSTTTNSGAMSATST
jgi:hypothetical protein